MDREKLKTIGKVLSVRRRDVKDISLADDYKLDFPEKSFLTDTGLLVVFELKSSDGPNFQARWDDADYALDFDVLGVPKAQQRRFKHSEDGSSGHHSVLLPLDGERIYHANIVYKGKPIYEGMVSINLDYSATARCDIRLGGSVE
jgi:hypothetical protein